MKQMSVRAIVLLILSALFVAGLGIFCVVYIADADDWAMYPANTHIYTEGALASAGQITDRSGTVLANTVNGKRLFNNSIDIRKATLHAVGDLDGFIETGMHTAYRKQLVGYNPINGVYQGNGTGNNIELTIDSEINKAALKALGSHKGTIGVYNYKTGEVVCMVSTPTYDVNDKPDIENNSNYKGAYINRFLSATYTPGSTFKVVTTAAGIDKMPDIYNKKYTCKGGVEVSGEWIKCMGYHGTIGIEEALAHSCNAYFSQLAVDLGQDVMSEYAEKMGFNQTFQMDGITAKKSFFNVEATRDVDLAWAGMGQQDDMMNPLQYLTMVGAIANGGVPVNPYMVESIRSPLGIPVHIKGSGTGKRMLSEDTAKKVSDMMARNVKTNYGTWHFEGLDVCGKTGTAEVKDQTPHAIFIGFTRDEDLPLAFVTVVENGGAGSGVAIPATARVLEAAKNVLRK